MKKYFIGLIIVLALITRGYRINTNSHFLSDEARDMVNIHQIFVDKKITLVGPISDDGNHLFSSLTYYLLLPFAALFGFEPIGTVVGAIFWGLITFGCLWWLVIKNNPKMIIPAGLLAAFWWPLVETSRWPWNPNMVVGWLALSILLSQSKNKIIKILSGLASGLALHHHFLAIISAGLIWFNKKCKWWIIGFGLALAPFIIFDLRHPPGLFLTKMIDFNQSNGKVEFLEIIPRFFSGIDYAIRYLFPGSAFSIGAGLLLLGLIVSDVKSKSKQGIYWGIATIVSLVVFVFYSKQFHYLLGTIPLLWMWLFEKREGLGKYLVYILVGLMGLSSIIKMVGEFSKDDFTGNLYLLSGATKIVEKQVKSQNLKNANIAVLGSEDKDGTGKRYRSMLLVKNVPIKSADEYVLSDNLLVITKKTEKELRNDSAAEIDRFKNGPVVGSWDIPKTEWKVIQFNKY